MARIGPVLQVETPPAAEAARWRELGARVTAEMEADKSLSPGILAAIRAALAEGGR